MLIFVDLLMILLIVCGLRAHTVADVTCGGRNRVLDFMYSKG